MTHVHFHRNKKVFLSSNLDPIAFFTLSLNSFQREFLSNRKRSRICPILPRRKSSLSSPDELIYFLVKFILASVFYFMSIISPVLVLLRINICNFSLLR